MFTLRQTTILPLQSGARVLPPLAVMLAAIIALQVLPVTLLPAHLPTASGGPGAETFFEPLQVCDSSGDFSGFLADHPWVSGNDGTAAFFPEQRCCEAPDTGRFTEGCRSNVFRPPRPFLS